MSRILVNGAAGSSEAISQDEREGHWVRGVDVKPHEIHQAPSMSLSSVICGTRTWQEHRSKASVRCINWLRIWAAQDISSLANTTRP